MENKPKFTMEFNLNTWEIEETYFSKEIDHDTELRIPAPLTDGTNSLKKVIIEIKGEGKEEMGLQKFKDNAGNKSTIIVHGIDLFIIPDNGGFDEMMSNKKEEE